MPNRFLIFKNRVKTWPVKNFNVLRIKPVFRIICAYYVSVHYISEIAYAEQLKILQKALDYLPTYVGRLGCLAPIYKGQRYLTIEAKYSPKHHLRATLYTNKNAAWFFAWVTPVFDPRNLDRLDLFLFLSLNITEYHFPYDMCLWKPVHSLQLVLKFRNWVPPNFTWTTTPVSFIHLQILSLISRTPFH